MLHKTTETLTAEKFQEIYTDEKFRNQVAFAHWKCDAEGNKKAQITCSYPVTYIVTPGQIAEAEAERQRAKVATIEANKGKLMLAGMGMTYEPRYEGDVCNHRVRGEFQNPEGRRFFIEFGQGQKENVRINHAVDRTREQELEGSFERQGEYYNYKQLERNTPLAQYTKANLLRIVNEYFDCNFAEVVIDNYNVSTEDYVSVSPGGWHAQKAG